jgi:hypothetical protein
MKKPHSSKQKPEEILSRYTSLPVLLDLIERESLIFLKPDTWQDRNSALLTFQPSQTVLALTPSILPTPLPEAPWQIDSSTSSNMPLRRLTSL